MKRLTLNRQTVAEKYDLKEIMYALRSLYDALKEQKEIEYEVKGLKRAMRILKLFFPRLPKEDCCPQCGHPVDNFFCPECGQQIYRNYRRRPIDELKRSTEYNHDDVKYMGLKQRREVDEYVRALGIEWVLSKLYDAERSADPPSNDEIRSLHLKSQEQEEPTRTMGALHTEEWKKQHSEFMTNYWNEYWKNKRGEENE